MTAASPIPSVLLFTVVVVVLYTFGCFIPCSAELPRVQHPIDKSDGSSLSLLVVGDWGRKGHYNQSRVATQMGKVGKKLAIDFVISTGDNFYENGLEGTHDKTYKESFTNIYTAASLQKQWYNLLGNHDYRGDVRAQLSPVLKKIDGRWFCRRSFILDAGIAQFFFVDTTPFVLKYWDEQEEHHYDWRDVAPRESYIINLLKVLDLALKESSATWKFVIGHHPIKSIGHHGDTQELVQLLLPILKANEVDLYINGHDHCLQHMSSKDSRLQYLTSGGGSKAWRGISTPDLDEMQFFYAGQGFMSLKLTKLKVKVKFYDIFRNVLYTWSNTKDFYPMGKI